MRPNYDVDDVRFHADAYTVKGYRGIAWCVLGWETVPDDDTEWSAMIGTSCSTRTTFLRSPVRSFAGNVGRLDARMMA